MEVINRPWEGLKKNLAKVLKSHLMSTFRDKSVTESVKTSKQGVCNFKNHSTSFFAWQKPATRFAVKPSIGGVQ